MKQVIPAYNILQPLTSNILAERDYLTRLYLSVELSIPTMHKRMRKQSQKERAEDGSATKQPAPTNSC